MTSSAQARVAVATLRGDYRWHHVPELRMASLLAPWFQQGWCLAAIKQAWERTPDDTPQTDGQPNVDPVATLAARLKHWRDEDGRPVAPPLQAWTDIQCRAERGRRSDVDPARTAPLELPLQMPTEVPNAPNLIEQLDQAAGQRPPRESAQSVDDQAAAQEASGDAASTIDSGSDGQPHAVASEQRGPRRNAVRPRPESIPRAFADQLAGMDLKLGIDSPGGRMTEPEQAFAPLSNDHCQRYGDYLGELRAQIRRDGPQSLTPAQLLVLRTRARSIKGLQASEALDI